MGKVGYIKLHTILVDTRVLRSPLKTPTPYYDSKSVFNSSFNNQRIAIDVQNFPWIYPILISVKDFCHSLINYIQIQS